MCDVLVFDRLISHELVDAAPPGAIRIGRDQLEQVAIDSLLVRLGQRDLEVVRLKGGDPFVFGRGGEEALALAAAGVPFEVVPGVSSLSAVPASAGIPITHRGVSSQVTVISGHDPGSLDFGALAGAPGTLVIFMGLGSLEVVAESLVAHGKAPDTPAAVIASGTLREQRVVVAPLEQIAVTAALLDPPALVVIGDVVALAGTLAADELLRAAAA